MCNESGCSRSDKASLGKLSDSQDLIAILDDNLFGGWDVDGFVRQCGWVNLDTVDIDRLVFLCSLVKTKTPERGRFFRKKKTPITN